MNNSQFAHMHLHTEYSQLDGFGNVDDYAARAKTMGFKYLACTDHGNIDGLIKFQKACKKQDIIPILGCELYIVEDAEKSIQEKSRLRGHLQVHVKSQKGFDNLCRMLTFANTDGFYYKPRVDYEIVLENTEGLCFSTACLISFLRVLPNGKQFFSDLYDCVGKDLYCEIMPHRIKQQPIWNRKVIRTAKRYGLKVYATNDCHYVKRTDATAQEVLLAIQRKATWKEKDRFRFSLKTFHLKTYKEMKRGLSEFGQYKRSYMTNTLEVAEKCSGYTIPKRDIDLPAVPGVPHLFKKERAFLLKLCYKGYKKIFGKDLDNDIDYKHRMFEEYDLITKKKFQRYFLMVWELINWCKKNDILVGPGRGSVGGSLIAYLMGITAVDPIEHNLLFSRFINEDRIDYPDIDIDFEDSKRHLVRQHLETMYGEDNVAGVSSFNRMKARAVLKDVGRVFGVHWKDTDGFTKLVEDNDQHTGIQDAIETYEDCRKFADENPQVIKLAKRMEGTIRGYSQHAAALVVSKQAIGTSGRCNLLTNKDNATVVNWEKEDTEFVGLMKLDVLGLKLLSVLAETVRLIKKNQGKSIDLEKININDQAVIDDINKGNTIGVFQLGTWATTNLIKEMGISEFDHLSATVALVRPGPANSGMTEEYIKRKNGASWEPMHEIYEEITKETYGLLVYQEQVMQVVSQMAGLPYSTADKVRKIIGKKRDVKEFEKYKKLFINGCKKTGYMSKSEALRFWRGLEKWSKYGFNKCAVGSTTIERANYNQYTGKFITLKDLYIEWHKNTSTSNKYKNKKRGLQILQEVDGCIVPGRVAGVYYNGKHIVYKVKTKGGRSFTGTRNHRLLTYNGYKEIQEMQVGDWLAIKGSCLGEYQKKGNHGWSKGLHWDNGCPPQKDGRCSFLIEAKQKCFENADGKCEHCGKQHTDESKKHEFEYAHIKPLEYFKGDYEKYHNQNNLYFLCNSCHKKMDVEQRGWFKKGYGVEYDQIVSIKYAGIEDTFDLEMEAPNHNFLANDIVSHNSHSVEYALLGYWCSWLKKYFPTEFICGSLTYGAKDKKAELVEEAYRLGLTLVLPKVGISNANKWTVKGKELYIPFIEVNGIGPTKAVQAASAGVIKSNIRKFYSKKNDTQLKRFTGSFGELLDSLGAYEPHSTFTVTDEVKKLFKFRVTANPRDEYSNLYSLFGSKLRLDRLDDLLECDYKTVRKISKGMGIIGNNKRTFKRHNDLSDCDLCDLISECKAPVQPSPGKYNAMIVGEAPGKNEDQQREGFVGRSGDKVWDYLNAKGYTRELFHVTNINKCYPSKSKKPSKEQIAICGDKYLWTEIQRAKPKVILSFGNTGLQYFLGQSSGIMNLSGRVMWMEKFKAWVVFCMHPSASLHNPDNKTYYEAGMKRFCKVLKSLRFPKN